MNTKNERKNNGQGIFYAVIGVATLVVTIIGATFAFFTATAGSGNNAVTAGAAVVSLGFDDNDDGLKGDLIPIDESNSKFASVVGTASTDCKDDNGNNICSVYEFTVSNPSTTTAQTIYPTFTSTVNEFTNLHYIIFAGEASDIANTANFRNGAASPISSAPLSASGTVASDGTIIVANEVVPATGVSHIATGTGDSTHVLKLSNMIQTLPASGEVTYTIVLWIHEISGDTNPANGGDQTAVDSVITEGNATRARVFEGGITFTTAGGTAGGVTGKLTTSPGA